MDTAYLVTDEQLKAQSSTVLQQCLHDLSSKKGHPLRDIDCVDYVEQQTTVRFPTTTWQHYRNGSRLRLPFLLLMSYVFKRSLATFLGPELARKDYRMAASQNGFVLDDYSTGDVSMVIPRELANSMHLTPGTAKTMQITKANNASPNLRFGSIAIIDTSFVKPSLSGSYLILKDGQPMFAAITANGAGNDISLHYGETTSQLDGSAIAALGILGRVIDTIG